MVWIEEVVEEVLLRVWVVFAGTEMELRVTALRVTALWVTALRGMGARVVG